MHPCLVTGREVEESVGDGKVMGSTHLEEQVIAVALADAMSSEDFFLALMSCSHLGGEVPEDNSLL